ncbi:MAG: hypothetical protein IT340_20670 [Chloroflexi bacterium]|nr:hypothetical protein [Chloroflexota bacterium]
MNQLIEDALQCLVGLPMWGAGRAGEMEWFQFGEQRALVTKEGSAPRVVGSYALHIQCAWRLVGHDAIIVASQDRYFPAGPDPYAATDTFDWDQPGANRCDQRINDFIAKAATDLIVSSLKHVDAVGSFTLTFAGAIVLEVFPDSSLEGEHWRLLSPGTDKEHFVVTGAGVET